MSTDLHRRSAYETRLLWLYGLYAVATGAYVFAKGGWLVLATTSTGVPAESNFIGHLMQAHAGSVVGLGCMAWGLSVARQNVQAMFFPLAVANTLFAMVSLLSAPARTPWVLAEMAVHSLWAILFARLAMTSAPAAPSAAKADALRRSLYISFAALVGLSGVVWLLAPMKFATAAAGSLAGVAAAYAGQTRGVADLIIAVLAWSTREWSGTAGRAITRSLCISNLLLATAGLIAQMSVLTTPARWVVEALHVIWAIGFGVLWHLESRSRSAAVASTA